MIHIEHIVNVNLCYIQFYIAQLKIQMRRNNLAVIISGAAMPYSAVWVITIYIFYILTFITVDRGP